MGEAENMAFLPATVSAGMFPAERVVTVEHLDGVSSWFVPDHYVSFDGASVRVRRLHVGLTWELLGVPSLDGNTAIVVRRGLAR